MRVPFPAYQGVEPYVFVCYSHDDVGAVYAELEALRAAGVRLWYDEGITPGSEWSEALARRIRDCGVFLFFVSPRSVDSMHCRREINFALDRGCRMLAVHLEPVELPDGLKLSLNDRQAILRYRYSEPDYRALVLRALREALPTQGNPAGDESRTAIRGRQAADSDLAGPAFVDAPPAVPGARSSRSRSRSGRGAWAVAAVSAGLIVAVAALLWWPNRGDPVRQEPAAEAPALQESRPGEFPTTLSVQVRPFEQQDVTPEELAFAERTLDELTTHLVDVRRLSIVRADASETPAYVLTGRIAEAGESRRITVRLESLADGAIVWTHTFDQPRTAAGFVAARQVALLTDGLSWTHFIANHFMNAADNPAGREWQLGVTEFLRISAGAGGDWQVAADHYKRAIRLEPGHWPAHLGLVNAYSHRVGQRGLLAEFLPEAHAATRAMLALRSANAEFADNPDWPFITGNVLLRLDLDYPGAERLYELARARGFSAGGAAFELGCVNVARGDLEAAVRYFETELAAGAGLNETITRLLLGGARLVLGQFERARQELQRGLVLTLRDSDLHRGIGVTLVGALHSSGDQAAAARLLDDLWSTYGDVAPQDFPAALVLTGRVEDARRVLDRMAARYPAGEPLWYWSTFLGHFHLGDFDAAFLWLDRVIDNREWYFFGALRRDPALEPLRADPRFAQAIARLVAIG